MPFIQKISEYLKNLFSKKLNFLYPLIVVFVALSWRLYRITTIPKGLNIFDLNSLQISAGLIKNHWVIGINQLSSAIYYYSLGLVFYLSQHQLIYIRVFQALIASLSVVLFYYFVKNWFNRQCAILAAIFMSTNFLMVLIGRNIEPKILIPTTIVALLLAFTLSFRTNRLKYFAITGILSGLAFYIDKIFIFLPFVAILCLIYLFLNKKNTIRVYLKGFIIAGCAALLVGAFPIYSFFQSFWQNISVYNPGSFGNFYINLGNNLQSLFIKSPVNNIYNVGTEPILDPFVSLTFLCGLVYALFYVRRKKFMILVGWFAIGIILISLKKQDFTDFTLILPVIFTFSGIILDYVLTHWVRTFPFNKLARLLMTFIFSVFLFLSIFYNYEKYFWAWGRNQGIQENYHYTIEYMNK